MSEQENFSSPISENSSEKPQTLAEENNSKNTESFPMPDMSALFGMIAMEMEPRALLAVLMSVFDGHAWRAMGFLADPKTGETHKDLPTAQLAIDTIQFILSKIESQMTEEEKRDSHRRLTDLRMNYLAKVREN